MYQWVMKRSTPEKRKRQCSPVPMLSLNNSDGDVSIHSTTPFKRQRYASVYSFHRNLNNSRSENSRMSHEDGTGDINREEDYRQEDNRYYDTVNDFDRCSVAELKRRLSALGVNFAHCTDHADMKSLLRERMMRIGESENNLTSCLDTDKEAKVAKVHAHLQFKPHKTEIGKNTKKDESNMKSAHNPNPTVKKCNSNIENMGQLHNKTGRKKEVSLPDKSDEPRNSITRLPKRKLEESKIQHNYSGNRVTLTPNPTTGTEKQAVVEEKESHSVQLVSHPLKKRRIIHSNQDKNNNEKQKIELVNTRNTSKSEKSTSKRKYAFISDGVSESTSTSGGESDAPLKKFCSDVNDNEKNSDGGSSSNVDISSNICGGTSDNYVKEPNPNPKFFDQEGHQEGIEQKTEGGEQTVNSSKSSLLTKKTWRSLRQLSVDE